MNTQGSPLFSLPVELRLMVIEFLTADLLDEQGYIEARNFAKLPPFFYTCSHFLAGGRRIWLNLPLKITCAIRFTGETSASDRRGVHWICTVYGGRQPKNLRMDIPVMGHLTFNNPQELESPLLPKFDSMGWP